MRRLLIGALLALPLTAWAASSDDDFFNDTPAPSPAPGAAPAAPAAPAAASLGSFGDQPTTWGGTYQADATWNPGWVGGWPGSGGSWKDGLGYDLLTTAFLDARPDKNLRFHLGLRAGYPFTSTTANVVTSSTPLTPGSTLGSNKASTTSITTNNIKVWELFADVQVVDNLSLRFGKQSASWGVSYFYSVADVISLTSIDVTNPTLQREGPIALKALWAIPALKANVTGFALARDDYFQGETPTIKDLGYALEGDILVGQAQLTLGGFYQTDNAAKLVGTINTGLDFLNLPVGGSINVFTEAILSRGSDALQGHGSMTTNGITTYQSLSNWPKQAYYTGTAGISYSNNDYNFSVRAEYLYNPFGSSDKDAASRIYGTYYAVQVNEFLPDTSSNSSSHAFGASNVLYTGIHNVTGLFDIVNIGGSKLEFSTLAQANLSDGSGWVTPYFTIYPWTDLGLKAGTQFVWGDNGTQYPMQFQTYSSSGQTTGTKRVSLVIEVFFGTGRY
jgi:hypothetical protein